MGPLVGTPLRVTRKVGSRASQVDRAMRGLGLEKQPGPRECSSNILPPTVCHLQAVPPGGTGAARPLSGYPTGSPEQLLQPGPAAGEYLEKGGEDDEKGLCSGLLKRGGCTTPSCLTLPLSPDKVPEATPQWPLPLPRPPAGLGRRFPRTGPHRGHAAAGCSQLCYHRLATGAYV